MHKKIKNIIAVGLVIIPFYLLAFLQKTLLNQSDIYVQKFLSIYMLLSIIGITAIVLINKYFLKNKWEVFASSKGNTIIDISLAFLILSIHYFINSLGRITYFKWIPTDIDRSAIINLLSDIFSNNLYGFIMAGPFNWLNELFAVLSIAFILNNLWEINNKKYWIWTSIIIASLLFTLLQIDQGIPSMINTFIFIGISNYIYFRYRRIYPLLIAAIIYQTIDLISFWIYY
jgi:membrane protease YdiL (CAAX protease family)